MRDKKALVIDTDFDSVKSLHRFLSSSEFQVIIAYDGEQGLEKAKTENPDLIILDPMLPKLNGMDLCNIISRDFERKIPVIILSKCYSDFKDDILHSFGAAAYLNKPFDKEELFFTIVDVLKEKTEGDAKKEQTAEKSPERSVEKNTVKLPGNGERERVGNNGKGNGRYQRQLAEILSSIQQDNGNNRKANGRKDNVDEILKDALSELGVDLEKKEPLEKKHLHHFSYQRL